MPASDHKSPAAVKIAGADLELEEVERIEVRNFTGLPDMATIRLADPEGEKVRQPPYHIGDTVEIRLGEATAASGSPVFKGEIVAAEVEFTTAAATLSFRAYDVSHRLHRNRRSDTFQDMTTSDIVQKVLGGGSVQVGQIDSTSAVHKHMQQSMETDLDFLRRLAALDNCEFGISEGKAFLRKRNNGSGATPEFAWRDNAISFKPRQTAAQQHDTVRVVSYDPVSKAAVVGEATTPGQIPAAAQQARDKGKTFGAAELLVADKVVTTQAEAKTLAQSTLDTLASASFEADGIMNGNPDVKAGGKLAIKGFGAPYDGDHYVTSVTHIYGHGDFRTKFAISGRNPRTLTDVMRPKQDRDWGSGGLAIGIVTNNDDKDGQGRVRVKFPNLGDSIESTWARIASPGAGKDRGMMFLPDVNDEVVVAFEHGDTRRPVVLGALYNGKDKPSSKMLTNAPRGAAWVVHTEHDAEFDFKEQFAITAKDKMVIEIKGGDKGQGEFSLKPSDKIEIDAGTTVKIHGTGDITIKSDAGVNVEAGGQLSLKGSMVNLEGTGGVTVKGSIINIG